MLSGPNWAPWLSRPALAASYVTLPQLLERAILHGSSTAAGLLLFDLHLAEAADQRAAYWSVDHIDDTDSIIYLLKALNEAGIDRPMIDLADRAARSWPLREPQGVAELLGTLHEIGADRQVGVLLDRDPAAGVSTSAGRVIPQGLLNKLREAAGERLAAALADRVTAETPTENLSVVWSMLKITA